MKKETTWPSCTTGMVPEPTGTTCTSNASYNGETYTFTIESYLCDNTTEVYSAVKNLEIGQTIDMEGFLYWYEGVNPHITAVTVVE